MTDPKPQPFHYRYLIYAINLLGFAAAASRGAIATHREDRSIYPRQASRRSIWKRKRARGLNPGGWAT